MKIRSLSLFCGLAFFGALGVVIGQRMTAEAMAVMMGVMAGAAASIPTSLMVVWFATRNQIPPQPPEPEMPLPVEPPEPRVVWMPAASAAFQAVMPPTMRYQNVAGYPPLAYPMYPYPLEPAPAPRRFTIIGGAEASLDDSQAQPEVRFAWPPR